MEVNSDRCIVFETKNQGPGGFSLLLQVFIVVMLGFPAIALPLFTWHELGEAPWLIVFYLAAWFPLVVLWTLRRLLTRYGLRIFSNGDAEIIYPFAVVQLPAATLCSISADRRFVAATNAYQSWIRFSSRDGNMLASLSAMAFRKEALQEFLEKLQQIRPDLVIKL